MSKGRREWIPLIFSHHFYQRHHSVNQSASGCTRACLNSGSVLINLIDRSLVWPSSTVCVRVCAWFALVWTVVFFLWLIDRWSDLGGGVPIPAVDFVFSHAFLSAFPCQWFPYPLQKWALHNVPVIKLDQIQLTLSLSLKYVTCARAYESLCACVCVGACIKGWG